MIEVQAIGLACERRQEADIEHLRKTLAQFRDNESCCSLAPRYDQEFHMGIFRATHNDVLVRLVAPFYIMARKRREVFFKDRERCRVSHLQHVEMLESIIKREKDRAARQMSAHIGRVEDFFGAS